MKFQNINTLSQEAPMYDDCNDCKNYEKQEKKIKWEGIVLWHKLDHHVFPSGIDCIYGLIGKTTKITIEEI